MNSEDLRKRAESYLETRRGAQEETEAEHGGENRDALIQDLQVHQVELKLQNEELRDAYARLEETGREYVDLFERAPMGLVVIDGAGIVRRCNATFRALIGFKDEACDWPLTDYVTEESAALWRGRFRAFFSHPEEKRIDLELALPDRRRRVIRLVGQTMDAPARLLQGKPQKKGSVLMLVAFEVTDEIIAREQSRDLVAEKELLLRELRHRTQNHLVTIQSMLSFQAAHAENTAVSEALTGAGERIRAMLFVNEILTSRRGQETIDVATYLGELLDQIGEAHMAQGDITVTAELAPLAVTADTAFTLGLVANELVTNAYKYAFPAAAADKTVRVTLHAMSDGRAELIVTDNGVGFERGAATDGAAGDGAATHGAMGDGSAPHGAARHETVPNDAPQPKRADAAGSSGSSSGGFGLHLVEGLVGQMAGTLAVENTGNGTRCRVVFTPGTAPS